MWQRTQLSLTLEMVNVLNLVNRPEVNNTPFSNYSTKFLIELANYMYSMSVDMSPSLLVVVDPYKPTQASQTVIRVHIFELNEDYKQVGSVHSQIIQGFQTLGSQNISVVPRYFHRQNLLCVSVIANKGADVELSASRWNFVSHTFEPVGHSHLELQGYPGVDTQSPITLTQYCSLVRNKPDNWFFEAGRKIVSCTVLGDDHLLFHMLHRSQFVPIANMGQSHRGLLKLEPNQHKVGSNLALGRLSPYLVQQNGRKYRLQRMVLTT